MYFRISDPFVSRITKLDPAHYMSSPGYRWDSCLLMTKAKFDLIADPNLLDMIEQSKQGG